MVAISITLGLGQAQAPASSDLRLVVSVEPGDAIPLEPLSGAQPIWVMAAAAYGGYYSVQTDDLSGGPVGMRAPRIALNPDTGALSVDVPGLWAYDAQIAHPILDYRWQRDGADIPGTSGPSYVPGSEDEGRTLRVIETATDANGARSLTSYGLAIDRFDATLEAGGLLRLTANDGRSFAVHDTADRYDGTYGIPKGSLASGPMTLKAPVLSGDGTPAAGETLTIVPALFAYDPDLGAVSVSYAATGTNAVDAADPDAPTLLIDAADAGATLTVTATALQGANTTASTSSGVSVPGLVPAISGTPAISGVAEVGRQLIATAAPVSGRAPISRSWQWLRNGTAIAGATSASYALTSADAEADISVRQTETNAAGSDSAFSAAVTVARQTALANTGLPVISGIPEIGRTLSVSDGTWAGSEPRGYTYRWTRGGVGIVGATSGIYTLAAADDGADIGCDVTADDTFSSVTASATAVSVTYAAPTAEGALADQIYTQDTGDQTVDVSGDFMGAAGGSWSVSGAGAAIDSAGVVTLPTGTLRSAVTVTATYVNSGGSAASAFDVTVQTAAGTTISQSSAPTLATPVAGDTALSAYSEGSTGTYTADNGQTISGIENQMRVDGTAVPDGYILKGGESVAVRETVTASDATVATFDSAAVTVAEPFSVTLEADGTLSIAGNDGRSFAVDDDADRYDGTYSVTVGSLSSGPVALKAPVLDSDGTPVAGETLTIIPALFAYDSDLGAMTVGYATTGTNGVDATDPDNPTLLIDAADAGSTITVTATATQGGNSTDSVSNGVSVAAAPSASVTASYVGSFEESTVNATSGSGNMDLSGAKAGDRLILVYGASSSTEPSMTVGGNPVPAAILDTGSDGFGGKIWVYEYTLLGTETASTAVAFSGADSGARHLVSAAMVQGGTRDDAAVTFQFGLGTVSASVTPTTAENAIVAIGMGRQSFFGADRSWTNVTEDTLFTNTSEDRAAAVAFAGNVALSSYTASFDTASTGNESDEMALAVLAYSA